MQPNLILIHLASRIQVISRMLLNEKKKKKKTPTCRNVLGKSNTRVGPNEPLLPETTCADMFF